MKVLRIRLSQASANYKKEEVVENKMTYPLPPFSTVIGAIHAACKFTEYKPMNVSIQGKYGSMIKELYTDHCFLNSTQDDRNTLVKMKNGNLLSTAYEKVAKAIKSQGNSFRKGITVQVFNEELIQEYRDLKDLADEIKAFKDKRLKKCKGMIKIRKNTLAAKKKQYEKASEIYKSVESREKEIKQLEKEIDSRMKEYENQHYKKPIEKFRTLTTSVKYYEVLQDIQLVLHIQSDEDTLQHIMNNVYHLKSIGRSEDFVEIQDVEWVELKKIKEDIRSKYSAYMDYNLFKDGEASATSDKIDASGTKYYLNKNYSIIHNKRVFEKKKVLYISDFSVDEGIPDVYLDDKDGCYIVNLL